MFPIKSEESVLSPLAEAAIFKGMAAPSVPFTSKADTLGASGKTVPSSVVLTTTVCSLPSSVVAVSLSVSLESFLVVIVRLERFHPRTPTEVEPDWAVKLLVPSLSVAPIGMLPITSDVTVPPPLPAAATLRGIAVCSRPGAGCVVKLGGSGGGGGGGTGSWVREGVLVPFKLVFMSSTH